MENVPSAKYGRQKLTLGCPGNLTCDLHVVRYNVHLLKNLLIHRPCAFLKKKHTIITFSQRLLFCVCCAIVYV